MLLHVGISTEHDETSSTSGALESVKTLRVDYNDYTQTLGLLTLPELLSPTTL